MTRAELELEQEPELTRARILFDGDAVVHLVDAEDLGLPAIAAKFVILAHDQRLDRLGGTHFRAEAAEAAARQIKVKVVEDFDLLARLAVAAERDEVVGTRLGALIADDTGLGPRAGLGLQTQDTPEARSGRPPLGRILEGESRLEGNQRYPQPFIRSIDEEDGLHQNLMMFG
jgi:hypothetical protein